jgi:hypothetical protein
MGAWAEGSFDNDDSRDWIEDLEDAEDISVLEEAFAAVTELGKEDYLEAPECCIAIAAAEVVAAMRKHPAAGLPEKVTAYVARIGTPPRPVLVAAALAALERIRTKSELQELWAENKNSEMWHQAVTDLESRLG